MKKKAKSSLKDLSQFELNEVAGGNWGNLLEGL